MGLLERIVDVAPRTKALTLSSIGQSATWSMPNHWVYPTLGSGSFSPQKEIAAEDFGAYIEEAYKANGIVFACALARQMTFSQARLTYQELVDNRPGRLVGGAGLDLFEEPWANASTSDLLSRMEQDGGTLAGNAYIALNRAGKLRRLRPDWVTILSGVRREAGIDMTEPWSIDAEVLGYIYHPKGSDTGGRTYDPVLLSVDKVAHYAPIPDPQAQWRGMSWLTPVLREISSDSAATDHKEAFFRRGAALSTVVRYDKGIKPGDYERYVELFDRQHAGVANAYKTLHLGGGADVTVVGTNLKDLDFRATQGAGETRIAAASGVGAIIAQLSEGLQGSALNAGNYGAAKRRFGDMTMRPLWGSAAKTLQKFSTPPPRHRLWYDDRDIEFLKEDRKDAVEIINRQAETIRALTDAGYQPDAVIDAVEAGDLSRLAGKHSGLFSVQLQRPGANDPVPTGGNP